MQKKKKLKIYLNYMKVEEILINITKWSLSFRKT